jgi:long-chain acyl-CoA synthetase
MGMTFSEATTLLQAAGSPFELTVERVLGRDVKVFKTRERSMREKVANAAVHGAKEFLIYEDRRISFGEFVELTWGAAHVLLNDYGLQRHDRVGILAYNRPEWLIALFGVAAAGGITVGLNGWWTSDELLYGLNDSGCRFLIVDELLWDRAAQLIERVPTLEAVFFIGKNAPKSTVPIEKLLVRRSDAPTVPVDEDDPFVILYTSGTTGRSKGCITTHRGTVAQVQSIMYAYFMGMLMKDGAAGATMPENPGTLLTSPLFHVAGLHSMVCTSLTSGSRLVFGPPRFDADAALQIMQKERITNWMAIPTLLQRLIESPNLDKYDLSTLQVISTAGAPTPPEIAARAHQVLQTKPNLATSYGLTEVHGMASSIGGDDYLAHKNSVGRPSPIVEVRIVNDRNEDVATGMPGQILLGGATVTPGYWNRAEDTAKTIIDGWLHTGDIGYVDGEGYLYISDRAKDMVIRAGENVYCVEVENVLAEHPEIAEAAVFGVPDRDLGERVKAVVVRRPGSQLSVKDVQAHVGKALAKFKVPEDVEFTDDPLPRNPAGKLLKNILRKTGSASFPPDTHL